VLCRDRCHGQLRPRQAHSRAQGREARRQRQQSSRQGIRVDLLDLRLQVGPRPHRPGHVELSLVSNIGGPLMMDTKTVRLWSRIHKWTSLVCTAFLLMLCLTGLPLIFGDEIEDLFDDQVSVANLPADTPPAPLERIVEVARQRYPSEFVQLFSWDKDQ